MSAALDIAVIVPTYKRLRLLARCLAALCLQTLPGDRYEIVVADDDGGSGNAAVTRQLIAELNARMRGAPAIRYLPVTATQGPAGARNAGWRFSNARIVAFTDDDTIPDRNWLAAGLSMIDSGFDAIGGAIRMPLPEQPTDYERDAAGLADAAFATANVFVTRAALEAVGGFDERFTDAWREDSDLHFELLRAGYRVGYAAAAIVEHPIRPAPFGVSLRQQRKVFFDALLFKKHRVLYRTKIRPTPPWNYYASVIALIGAAVSAIAGAWPTASTLLALWLVLTLHFAFRRLKGTSHRARDVAEVLWTSVGIPPLSVYWRLAGALRFRVAFL